MQPLIRGTIQREHKRYILGESKLVNIVAIRSVYAKNENDPALFMMLQTELPLGH